jgi:hypothetical protein
VNFRNTIILDDLERRLGHDQAPVHARLRADHRRGTYEKARERVLEEAKKTFRPEFLNRLDDLIVFRSFTKPDLIQILSLEVEKVLERLRKKNLKLELDDKAKDFSSKKATTRNTARVRCAARSSVSLKTRSPRKFSRARCTKATLFKSPPTRTNCCSIKSRRRRMPCRTDSGSLSSRVEKRGFFVGEIPRQILRCHK